MSDENNPYQAPKTAAAPIEAHPLEGANVTTTMIGYLRETRPWVRFLAVLGFISLGFFGLGGIVMGAMSLFSTNEFFGLVPMIFPGILYIGLAVLYAFPVLHLHRFAGSLKELLADGGSQALEHAMRHQKSFWKFTGILALVGVGLGVVGIIFTIFAGIIAALS